jgi:hypothetical protein
VLVVLLSIVPLPRAEAQTHKALAKPEAKPAPRAVSGDGELPITRVALYKNGVGFFEHAGRVTGDQPVTIDFTSTQLNDVLQSLTAIDLNGGRISGAGYNSTTPLEQQLRSMPLALSGDPSDVDFYNAIRGARVSVTGAGSAITGRLLSIDLRTPEKKEGGPEAAAPETGHRFVTVVSESGQVRTVELTPMVSVTLLDTALHTDVTRYLELLASTRNQGLRHLTLLDRGTGPRELRVSYISEVPVWKSTYRILFSVNGSSETTDATLQGWSVVDNTTGSDWTNVHLDLIAGAPQSFLQPLSVPYYTRRPEIPLPAEAQLTPQTHESGDAVVADAVAPAPPPAPGAVDETVSVSAAAMPINGRSFDRLSKFSAGGVGYGSGGGVAGGVLGGVGRSIGGPVYNYEQAAESSNNPQTTTTGFDDFFEYSLTDPITIRKNESALVPILQTKVPAEPVTLWSANEPVPLRALWITNSSNLTLDRGSFSIIEGGNFGGEGLLDPIHPGEKRLLSYAADQAVRVSTDHTKNTRRVLHLSIKKGVMTETSTDVAEVEYLVHNAAPEPRTVIVEQPVRQGWTLDSETKPAETTPTAYRFRVAVEPRKADTLHIAERHTNYEYIRLVDRSIEDITLLIQNAKASPAFLKALQPVFDLHNQVVELDAQIKAHDTQVTEITKDQDRLRENMKALKGSAEERALLQRYTGELNAQEDKLALLRTELTALHAQRVAKDLEFQAELDGVEVDEAL